MPTIDYYISLNSPWTYLGSARFAAMAKRHGAKVQVKPTKFGEVFAQTGGLPLPKRAPARQAYRLMELRRWRDQSGLPIVIQPKVFPADETMGARLVIAAALAGLDAHRLAGEIGRGIWELEQTPADPAMLAAAANRAGIDATQLRAHSPADSILDAAWDANTAEAIARGVFGAPSYVFPDGEIFWGQDRLDFVEKKLVASRD